MDTPIPLDYIYSPIDHICSPLVKLAKVATCEWRILKITGVKAELEKTFEWKVRG